MGSLNSPTAALYSCHVTLRPTRALPLARPFGKRAERDSSMSRAVSTAPQARMKTSASCSIRSPSPSAYTALRARPRSSTVISRTYESGRRSQRPVATASGTNTLSALERVPVGSPCCWANALITVGGRPLYGCDSAACGVGNELYPSAAQPAWNFCAYRDVGIGGHGYPRLRGDSNAFAPAAPETPNAHSILS